MKLKQIHLSFVLPTLLLASCSTLSGDSNRTHIAGTWKWLYSTGGFAGRTISPDSAGYSSQHILFLPTEEFKFFRADTLAIQGTYSTEKYASGDDFEFIISYNSRPDAFFSRQIVRFQGRNRDTLLLLDECSDCFLHRYVRLN